MVQITYKHVSEALIEYITSDKAEDILDEDNRIFFAFWERNPDPNTQHPTQPHICRGTSVNANQILDLCEIFDNLVSVQIILEAADNDQFKFYFSMEAERTLSVFSLEHLNYEQAVDRIDQMLINGGRPYNYAGDFFHEE